ncbi:permease prefix domain 1-containing protein [Myceligenerans crystallogenes]|uniref:permease prefix domain 1-containing protein n=1 Tax=Myceligenerans crystallogenes TaxID=316335 RepID=UPI0031D569A6
MSPVTTYLDELGKALVGPARVRRDLLREAAGHLEDATEAHAAAGLTETDAAARAVADFGSVAEVAPGFQTTLAVASARRTAWLLFGVLVVQPFLWDGGLIRFDSTPAPGGPLYATLGTAVETTGAVTMALAALLLVATRIGARRAGTGRSLAVATAGVAMISAALMVGTGLALTALGAGRDPAGWILVTALVVVPMGFITASARRTLATC